MGLTPMMQQYLDIHEKVPDAILFFRLGDFYEMFFDDAIKAAKVLEIALTGRDCGLEERAPMCGVPYHAAESYIAKLIEKGYKVAICEQLEDPAIAKGIVKRDIVRVLSPGTITDEKALNAGENNYLMSLYLGKKQLGMAYVDVSTGEFYTTEIVGSQILSRGLDEIGKIAPAELLVNGTLYKENNWVSTVAEQWGAMINPYPSHYFEVKKSEKRLCRQFDVFTIDALGLRDHEAALRASGALLAYLDETQRRTLGHLNNLRYYKAEEYMLLDRATRRNLELSETLRRGDKKGSLLWVLDHTATAMGARMLRRWIEAPLLDLAEIKNRQLQIEELTRHSTALDDLRKQLLKVYDLERISGKLAIGNANPKDLLALKQSLQTVPEIKKFLMTLDAPHLQKHLQGKPVLNSIADLIERGISDDAPFVIKDGGVIADGFHEEIDEIRSFNQGGKNRLQALEQVEREKTGIKTLKVKYNRVFGYFIEVTKSYLDQVPEAYIRKQTLTNAERYFTPELKELEGKILGSEERLLRLEAEIFADIRNKVLDELEAIQNTATEIAELDTLYALAKAAILGNYVKPEVTDSNALHIEKGRHPVVEKLVGQGNFITNNTDLNAEDCRVMLITGPNMAGKSTYIRQVAIITLMAQIGSFVPAERAVIGITDRIFTRVGASDDLATGQSTFMVEMTEVSNILKNATERSLVILDEIGRGTSTFDGISIAWAVVEYLWDTKTCGAKTLFATHYHELTELENTKPGVVNFSIRVQETAEGVLFLRKLVRGPADKSYGIEVARLAGFPKSVTDRAEAILSVLDEGETSYREGVLAVEKPDFIDNQMHIFNMLPALSNEESQVLDSLRDLPIDEMTPMEAMNSLYHLQKTLKEDHEA